ncbi:glucose-1-phosphate adenylyltransferase subunit GlgD [Ethanoligenens harbinense]|uniref:Glucose-1-phosphate adenylyltransferase, GlgD subunit n=1 Tax=Ethanoligenens harbinense (strain DSM 18485 / JCM 12961 / CGMCC 1.5033 / YUAN-3) TaxID=663278 RepID=E6U340_ETHHY|nr:glucose-1-phosphate adenylyltransferase subunit GlgD [Ethanoligenens harbinense]ADU27512.1 glucose-1-phosphate adenylyltransferase, GlgD subunit [Ethanoligenens harbinense YUAN-3]AVQ96565.1 glucose-1-phosphate adenylyltransferase subunit GlgD [Ethanoligenens harbinense YUAN-3]AYF42050.1 glucose-1-phosphate adenylyltransferase subunit GlgD [Ethanoligenens harbinense]QCN92805.1 glucose-1-phosphate adenylyltransferase subunit GlgD [Ethanoligenens harbinense]
MNNKTTGIIFADISDGNLHELTAHRPTASVPFGGRYRLIDFVLSNFHRSDITDVGVIVQSNYRSLMDHLGSGKDWDLSRKHGGLSLLPPLAGQRMYHTRLEALCGIRNYLSANQSDYVILADSDVIYSMDLSTLLERHAETDADITAVYRMETLEGAPSFSIHAYETDQTGRITAIVANPKPGEQQIGMHLMVFNKPLLLEIINEAASYGLNDLHRDILQKRTDVYHIYGWEFGGYAARIDSLPHYLSTNIDLLDADVREDLFHRYGSVCTRVRDEVPAQYGENASVTNSFIADGCVIEGEVENSILFRGVTVGSGTKISNSIVLKNSHVGSNATLDYCIIDKEVQVRDDRSLMGYGTYPLFISSGSIV